MRVIEHHTLSQKGVQRDLFYSVKPGARHLVLVLHGAGGSARGYLKGNEWLAAGEEFAVLAPQGLNFHPWSPPHFEHNPQVWNSGHFHLHCRTQFDDVAFLKNAIAWARRRFRLDGKLFIAGHSMGGTMGLRFIEENPGAVDTIFCAASGWLRSYHLPNPADLPHLVYACGSKDPLNPFDGGYVRMPWIEFSAQPVMHRLDAWARLHGQGPMVKTRECDRLTEWEWPGARLLRLIRIDGHGHAWPKGSASGVRHELLGPSVSHFDATQYALDLFRQRTLGD